MNTIDIVVSKILVEPFQHIDSEICCWEIVVETEYYGRKDKKVIRKCSKQEIDVVKPGYSWRE